MIPAAVVAAVESAYASYLAAGGKVKVRDESARGRLSVVEEAGNLALCDEAGNLSLVPVEDPQA